MILELFSLGATAGALRANIDWRSPFFVGVGQFVPKLQVEGDVPHQPFFVSENWMHRPFTRYNNVDRSFFSFVTIHAFD